MATVEFTQAQKRFGTVVAVDSLDLVIDPQQKGELFSLLGPSGCGKTTTLRLLAGFEQLTGGTVRVDGRVMNDVPPQDRGIGLVFQDYAIFPTMSVFKNVAYGLEVKRLPAAAIRRRVHEVLEVVGMGSLAERMPAQLSGGQLQRVAVARALVIRPSLLLFDEPLSNLDAGLRVSLRREIRKVQQEMGITALYVTHDQEEAMAISDRIGVMNQGRLEQVGSPREIFQRPVSRFVAEFIGQTTIYTGLCRSVGPDIAEIQLEDGPVLRLPRRDGVTPGSRLWVSIRPHDLVAGADGEGLTGSVAYMEYLGSAQRGELAVPGLSRNLLFEVHGHMNLAKGDSLHLAVVPEAIAYGEAEA